MGSFYAASQRLVKETNLWLEQKNLMYVGAGGRTRHSNFPHCKTSHHLSPGIQGDVPLRKRGSERFPAEVGGLISPFLSPVRLLLSPSRDAMMIYLEEVESDFSLTRELHAEFLLGHGVVCLAWMKRELLQILIEFIYVFHIYKLN